MSKQRFRVLDSDLHVIEPKDLNQRYLGQARAGRAVVDVPGAPGFRIVDVAGDQLSTRVVHLHGATTGGRAATGDVHDI
jgi:hypothetical protein